MKRTVLIAVCLMLTASWAAVDVRWNGGIFPRFTYNAKSMYFDLMAAELIAQAQVTTATRDVMSGYVQVFAAGHDGGAWRYGFHFGQAYVMMPLGLGWPAVKAGQAVVPFGLLASYDIHSQIIQTTFDKTIGLRTDPGVGLQGAVGVLDYSFWFSNGNGVNRHENDKDKVYTLRVAPKFLLGDAELSVGLSALDGSLPYFPIESLAAVSRGPTVYAKKYRLGLDNTTDWGPLTLRLEGVAGKDSSMSHPIVFGYYAEGRYAFVRWLEALLKYDGWHANGGSVRVVSGGLNFTHPDYSKLELQTAYERVLTKIPSIDTNVWRFTTLLAFR